MTLRAIDYQIHQGNYAMPNTANAELIAAFKKFQAADAAVTDDYDEVIYGSELEAREAFAGMEAKTQLGLALRLQFFADMAFCDDTDSANDLASLASNAWNLASFDEMPAEYIIRCKSDCVAAAEVSDRLRALTPAQLILVEAKTNEILATRRQA